MKCFGKWYNDSVRDPALAKPLADWLKQKRIQTLITPADSEMARAAKSVGIQIIAEAFADRRYIQAANGQLQLLSRTHPEAVYETLDDALAQCKLLEKQQVMTHTGERVSIQADTLCIHSDSDISFPLLQALNNQTPPFEMIATGLSAIVTSAQFGGQSHGITPGGPQDRFSFATGHALLGSATNPQSLEFIIPPVLKITRPMRCILTGARFQNSRIKRGAQTLRIPHATVFEAQSGDEIRFDQNICGLRGYMSWNEDDGDSGITRPALPDLVTWRAPRGLIRLIKGPEFERLIQTERLISTPWKIGLKSSAMGIQLETPGLPLETEPFNMISAPVTDGTVQLTPNGPIVLMRHRQTVGGYPRIANVIEVDLDRLAQFKPGQVVRFTWTDIKSARDLLEQRQSALQNLSSRRVVQ